MADFVELSDVLLSPEFFDQINEFNCTQDEGKKDIAEFLKHHAYELQKSNMAITRLFFNASGELVGYFTLFNDIVPRIGKSKLVKEQWALPNERFYPAIRLHYFGVDDRYKRMGIGHTMIHEVFNLCYNIAQQSGCTFISIEALLSAVDFYKKYDFKVIGRNNARYYNMVFKIEELEE